MAKGLCNKHKHQVRTHGIPQDAATAERKFWAKVDRRGPDDCWPWTKTTTDHGYGYVRVNGAGRPTHRVAYEYAVGPIPPGLELDHRCHTPDCTLGEQCPHRRCCNPRHLKPVTLAENSSSQRSARTAITGAIQRAITHCPQGHEYTPENTRIDKRGWRTCRQCMRER